jgi:hypothetical protein
MLHIIGYTTLSMPSAARQYPINTKSNIAEHVNERHKRSDLDFSAVANARCLTPTREASNIFELFER